MAGPLLQRLLAALGLQQGGGAAADGDDDAMQVGGGVTGICLCKLFVIHVAALGLKQGHTAVAAAEQEGDAMQVGAALCSGSSGLCASLC
jgi:hypothetical protein